MAGSCTVFSSNPTKNSLWLAAASKTSIFWHYQHWVAKIWLRGEKTWKVNQAIVIQSFLLQLDHLPAVLRLGWHALRGWQARHSPSNFRPPWPLRKAHGHHQPLDGLLLKATRPSKFESPSPILLPLGFTIIARYCFYCWPFLLLLSSSLWQ